MKILTYGKVKPKPIIFNCEKCGCIFEADYSEYEVSTLMEVMHDGLGAYKCECPCCKNIVYGDRR